MRKSIQDRIKIVIGCDETYFNKAADLWASLCFKPYAVDVLCIGFDAPESGMPDNWRMKRVELTQLKSYTKGYPENRDFYWSPESGDFLDFFDYNDDDIILQMDADGIVQRELNARELGILGTLKYRDVAGSFFSYPRTTLGSEWNNLRPKEAIDVYNPDKNQEIICCGLIAAYVRTYREIIRANCSKYKNRIHTSLKHHASMQWFINYFASKEGRIVDLGNGFHDAFWFSGHKTEIKYGKLYNREGLVFFNHTKFDKRFYF